MMKNGANAGLLGFLLALSSVGAPKADAAVTPGHDVDALEGRLSRLTGAMRESENYVRSAPMPEAVYLGYAFLNSAPSFRNYTTGWINRVGGWINKGTFYNTGVHFLNNAPSFRNTYNGWPNHVAGWLNGGGFRNGAFGNGGGFRNGGFANGGGFRNGGGFANGGGGFRNGGGFYNH